MWHHTIRFDHSFSVHFSSSLSCICHFFCQKSSKYNAGFFLPCLVLSPQPIVLIPTVPTISHAPVTPMFISSQDLTSVLYTDIQLSDIPTCKLQEDCKCNLSQGALALLSQAWSSATATTPSKRHYQYSATSQKQRKHFSSSSSLSISKIPQGPISASSQIHPFIYVDLHHHIHSLNYHRLSPGLCSNLLVGFPSSCLSNPFSKLLQE